ncbi:hypothetical protein B0O99DRAFT_523259 [Bisporella sp. PMI_857]|nr:hypothetical protein B0O99DRAFT_523259 [Bisporella sp. PMI_857]
MSSPRLQISSPLEAGASLLDEKRLPPILTEALEYVSSRLVRKQLHLSLIVIRKNTHALQSPVASPNLRRSSVTSASSASSVLSPARSLFDFSMASSSPPPTSRSTSACPSPDLPSPSLSRTKWPSLPSSPNAFKSSKSTPSTCSSPVSSPALTSPSSLAQNPWGISLMHACALTPRSEKYLRLYISRAERKFPSIGSGWLSSLPLSTNIMCGATNDLIRRSLMQNSVLFSSEGLTLLDLDHVYTFKCHLQQYSKTLRGDDLGRAVDELRRMVLVHGGKRITKGYLMRAYDWLGVSLAALVDVNEAYKNTYGGRSRAGGIEVEALGSASPPPLETNLRPKTYSLVQVGESAKGREGVSPGGVRGAKTPNGSDDITPVTQGEWLCLMVGKGWERPPKEVQIVSC